MANDIVVALYFSSNKDTKMSFETYTSKLVGTSVKKYLHKKVCLHFS